MPCAAAGPILSAKLNLSGPIAAVSAATEVVTAGLPGPHWVCEGDLNGLAMGLHERSYTVAGQAQADEGDSVRRTGLGGPLEYLKEYIVV